MEKRLRSSLKNSADEFLSSAAKLGFRSVKPSLKAIIHSLKPSSDVVSSLPLSLHQSISNSITRFKELSDSTASDSAFNSPQTPLTKRVRRSSRRSNNGDGVNDEVSGTNDQETKRQNAKIRVTENLQIYCHVALMCVKHPKNVFNATDLLPAARELHDNLILFELESNLLMDIANLCEEWWKGEFPGREGLISQSLPFLLSKSLTLKKKVDVHRVYSLREAFTLFDFEDESIEDLKLLLIRCLISPLYLKMDEGRRFLAFISVLSRQLMKEALAMIKSQIPFGRKSMLEAYADIVFRAWKVAERESKEEIETEFLQGLVESSIHASTGLFAASIRKILGGFISQRTTDGVEKLLFNLAEPVIFRSLQVANSNVRQNALHLLIDVFPLEVPDATREVKDTLLHKQFFLIEKLLMDECPDVRVVAVEGACRILHLFWEIIPSSTITKLITKILDDMAHDVCNEVRLSTVNGIIYLLGNPQSHEILKATLPRLGHLILDSALSIRVAVVDLLLLLKDIRNFQFHKVVHLDVLLSSLANDQSVVGQKLTKLLLPSYFPSTLTPEEACHRCVTLIKRSPLAGSKFCEFALSEGASPLFLSELFKVIINLVMSPDNLRVDQIDGMLTAAANICNTLATEAIYKATLKEELTGKKLKCLFAAATTGRAQSSVCTIVSTLSPDVANVLREECMAVVTQCIGLSDNMERQAEVRSFHRMMLACGSLDYMLDAFTRLLQRTAEGCISNFCSERTKHGLSSGKKRKVKSSVKVSVMRKHATTSRKKHSDTAKVSFDEDYAISVGIAWQLKDMLTSDNTRRSLLGSRSLDSAFRALKVISEVSIVQCFHCDYMSTSPLLAYTSLSLHMSIKNLTSNGSNNHGLKTSDCLDSSSEQALLAETILHLLDCTDRLFKSCEHGKSSKATPVTSHAEERCRELQLDDPNHRNAGSSFTRQKRISNMVKLLTAILKFIVDSSAMDLIYQEQERCLKVTRKYVAFVIHNLRQHSHDIQELKEEDLKETFLFLKSSFTYAAKLLNLVLASSSEAAPASPEAYNLANHLIDLIISVEEHLGPKFGSLLLSVAKLWLPDLILAMGSLQVQELSSSSIFCQSKSKFPSWPLILARIEFFDQSEAHLEEEDDRVPLSSKFSTFRKLVEIMIQLLRANHSVLDAVGAFLLAGSVIELEKKDFKLLFGLLHFICVKLVKHENREWRDLKLMLESLQHIYPRIEKMGEELRSEHGKENLDRAKALVEPVWRCYIDVMSNEHMEADFTE